MTTIQSVADAVVCAYTAQYNTDLATRDAAVQRLLASHEALRAALEQERGLLLTFNAETAEVTGELRAERDAAVADVRKWRLELEAHYRACGNPEARAPYLSR